MHDPRQIHLQAAYRVLAYLKYIVGQGLLFHRPSDLTLGVYTDADFAWSLIDRKSTTGYCTYLGGNLIRWHNKKQKTVSRSSAESELRALAKGVCEVLWIKGILQELKMKLPRLVHIMCDNKSALAIVDNPIAHEHTKHVDVDRHFIKDQVE